MAIPVTLGAGWVYWQQNKKRIIRNAIESKISNATDSLYFIRYDSSSIDEINGNAAFFHVNLQSDSLQNQLLQFDSASSAVVYNVHIDAVSIRGVNTAALLNNSAVTAKSIHLVNPVVYIISAGKKEKQPAVINENLALYERLLGKYENIQAGEIVIENGSLFFSDKTGNPHTSLTGIGIQLNNFSINRSKDYRNIPSYFIKDVVATVKEINIQGEERHVLFSDVEYNAPGKFIRIKKFQQKNNRRQLVFDINNTIIRNISTDSFILGQQLTADELVSDGGMLTFYPKQNRTVSAANDEIELDNNYFDEAQLNKISMGSTRVFIYSKSKPNDAPLQINNVRFAADDIQKLYSGTNVKNLVSRSNWTISADGFSFLSANRRYKLHIGSFNINKEKSSMYISRFSVMPQLTEKAFSASIKYQDDLYQLDFKNVELNGLDARLLVTGKRLEAETLTLQPMIKVFNDRMVTANPASKVGKYPHQLLAQVNFPVNIKKLVVSNGYVAYKERGAVSEQTGTVFFSNVNATVLNVTNVPDVIKLNDMMVLNARTRFMGVSDIQTTWKLRLGVQNGAFNVSGSGGGFDATAMNAITEPLGMVSIKKGQIKKITFDLAGTNLEANATSTLLYDNLKIIILEKDSSGINKKRVSSFVANLMVRNQNPEDGKVRTNNVTKARDVTKSFFFLLWKTIFEAAQKTVAGKSMD